MKWDNFLIARRTFYLGQITVAESMLTVIVGVANILSLSDCVVTSVDVAEVGDVRHLLQK